MSEKNIELLRDKMKRATLIKVDYGSASRLEQIDLLCRTMADAAQNGPVKAEYEGHMFVVEKGETLVEVMQKWKEQAGKPFMETVDPDVLATSLKLHEKDTDLDDTARSFFDSAATEVLVQKYPEYIDKLSMLHLLNAFIKSSEKNSDVMCDAFRQSVRRFSKGEKTFPLTLKNMIAIDQNKLLFTVTFGHGVNRGEFEKRISEAELKMLKSLKPFDLVYLSGSVMAAGIRIAEKHKDSGNFKKMFTQEVQARLSQGKMLNPQVYD